MAYNTHLRKVEMAQAQHDSNNALLHGASTKQTNTDEEESSNHEGDQLLANLPASEPLYGFYDPVSKIFRATSSW